MIYVLSFRDHTRNSGGAVFGGQLQQWTATDQVRVGYKLVSELAAESRVTFLVHGFNVSLTDGRDRLLKLADMLQHSVAGALVATLWPGDSPFLGPISFPFEGDDADDTAENLVRFVVTSLRPETPISFVTHSLGARVAMRTAEGLIAYGFPIDQVCLMAAAIDNDSLAHDGVYRQATEHAGRVAVLHSNEDEVLRCAYPAADLLQAFLFWRDSPGFALGYRGPVAAVGHGGPVPGNVIDKAVGRYDVDHGDYLPPASAQPNTKQQRAVGYARDMLARVPCPSY